MTTLGYVLMVVGLGLIGFAIWSLAGAVSRLASVVTEQAVQIATLQRRVDDAMVLARKRLAGGRSGR